MKRTKNKTRARRRQAEARVAAVCLFGAAALVILAVALA